MRNPQILIRLRQVPAQHLQVRVPPNSKEHGPLATPSNVPFWYPHHSVPSTASKPPNWCAPAVSVS